MSDRSCPYCGVSLDDARRLVITPIVHPSRGPAWPLRIPHRDITTCAAIDCVERAYKDAHS